MQTADATMVSRDVVEDFLYAECALLDDQKFADWLALFTSEGRYWIPASKADIDPTREVSIVYDDHASLSERVWRLESRLAYAQEPRSTTAHMLGNVRICNCAEADTIDVQAQFHVTEFRRRSQNVYAGRVRYQLRQGSESGFMIALKKVELVNLDGHLGNLSLLL